MKFDSAQQIDGRMFAVKIELESGNAEDDDSGDDAPDLSEVEGLIADFEAVSKTFSLNGYSATVDATTTFESGGEHMDSAAFFSIDRNGVESDVKGVAEGDVIAAVRIELDD